LKSNLREKASQQASLLNNKYAIEKCTLLATKLHQEGKRLVKTEDKISEIKQIQNVYTRKLEKEDISAVNTNKNVKAALAIFKHSKQSKDLRKSRYY